MYYSVLYLPGSEVIQKLLEIACISYQKSYKMMLKTIDLSWKFHQFYN